MSRQRHTVLGSFRVACETKVVSFTMINAVALLDKTGQNDPNFTTDTSGPFPLIAKANSQARSECFQIL